MRRVRDLLMLAAILGYLMHVITEAAPVLLCCLGGLLVGRGIRALYYRRRRW